jgi:hypothetical protein
MMTSAKMRTTSTELWGQVSKPREARGQPVEQPQLAVRPSLHAAAPETNAEKAGKRKRGLERKRRQEQGRRRTSRPCGRGTWGVQQKVKNETTKRTKR